MDAATSAPDLVANDAVDSAIVAGAPVVNPLPPARRAPDTEVTDHEEATMSNDLPEGVADAAPATGWESADVADGETRERGASEAGAARLPSDAATGYDAEAQGDVESAEVTQGVDPDLATDADADGDA